MAHVLSFLLAVNSIVPTWQRAKTAVNSNFNSSSLLEMVAVTNGIFRLMFCTQLFALSVTDDIKDQQRQFKHKKQLQTFGGFDVLQMFYKCALSWAALIMRVCWVSQMSRHSQVHGLLMKCYWRGGRQWDPKSLWIKAFCDSNHPVIESLKILNTASHNHHFSLFPVMNPCMLAPYGRISCILYKLSYKVS